MLAFETNAGNANAAVSPNPYNGNRSYQFMVETTSGSNKSLGIAVNTDDLPYSFSNTSTQNSGWRMMGFFNPTTINQAYNFTGQHSSMPSDTDYDDIMQSAQSQIGMVVCSSGRIYNFPEWDGTVPLRQVDNITSIDAQPMTRLCTSYKDKTVLGVIASIEKEGIDRVDNGATSWTGNLPSDADGRRRIRVASIGEGAMWVTNEHGFVRNGDYITSSNTRGYGTRQDDALMYSYTIAKATMDCSFDAVLEDEYKTRDLGDGLYASYIAVTFHCG